MVALAVAFTIDLLIFALLFLAPCFGVPLVIVCLTFFGFRWRIAPNLSTSSRSDRVAWAAFVMGTWTMLVTAVFAIRGEGDGSFRTWDQIHRQVRIFLAGAIVGAGVPLLVTIWQHVRRVGRMAWPPVPRKEDETGGQITGDPQPPFVA